MLSVRLSIFLYLCIYLSLYPSVSCVHIIYQLCMHVSIACLDRMSTNVQCKDPKKLNTQMFFTLARFKFVTISNKVNNQMLPPLKLRLYLYCHWIYGPSNFKASLFKHHDWSIIDAGTWQRRCGRESLFKNKFRGNCSKNYYIFLCGCMSLEVRTTKGSHASYTCGSQKLNSGHQAYRQAPLPTTSSCWPRK